MRKQSEIPYIIRTILCIKRIYVDGYMTLDTTIEAKNRTTVLKLQQYNEMFKVQIPKKYYKLLLESDVEPNEETALKIYNEIHKSEFVDIDELC